MVEPVSLSLGAIVAGLAAKAVGRAGDEAVAGGASVLRRVGATLRARFSRDEVVGGALARVEDAPDSPSRVRALAEHIDAAVQRDAGLREELEELVRRARGEGVDVEAISQVAWGDQNVQNAGLVDSTVDVSYGSSAPRQDE
jgi:hypothetical protein